MEEQGTLPPSPDPRLAALPGAGWSDLSWLALLLLLVTGLRAWQLTHTEVPARDAIAYVRTAWRLEHGDWQEAVRQGPQHPGYPAALLAVSHLTRHYLPDDPARAMMLAAQLASAVASLLLVFPLYYLGKELFDGRVGFWGTLLVQVLPSTGRLMADGLSEPVFLFLACSGLLCAFRGLRMGSLLWLAGAGLFGGLAYWTRVEGALVVLAAGLVLLGMQVAPRWRCGWGRLLARGAALALPAAVVALPFMLLIGGITVKPVRHHLTSLPTPAAHPPEPIIPLALWKVGEGLQPCERTRWAAHAVGLEIVKSTFYVLWLPALAGLLVFRDRFRKVPGVWMLPVMDAVLVVLFFRIAQVLGYLSERHLVLITVPSFFFAAAGLGALLRGLGKLLCLPSARVPALAGVLLALLVATPLPRTLAPLHGDRGGFRQAGEWIASHADPHDEVVDPYAWAGYYSGRIFTEKLRDAVDVRSEVCYVVLEEGISEHHHLWWLIPPAKRLAERGQIAARFPGPRGTRSATVNVYRVELARPGVQQAQLPGRR